ncbi:DUF5133 domain-containing protein [Streptomyces sp. NPDC048416]|uniref:DUF5133 domain-containing protein n=1 Tax=Streptomyces sp. NPDC048416 TaxID=3365546 RepID=UPI00371069EC
MLAPHPKTLRLLLAQYAEARIAHAYQQNPRAAEQLKDVSSTLCVVTATSCVEDAIAAADLLLAQASTVREADVNQADLAA